MLPKMAQQLWLFWTKDLFAFGFKEAQVIRKVFVQGLKTVAAKLNLQTKPPNV